MYAQKSRSGVCTCFLSQVKMKHFNTTISFGLFCSLITSFPFRWLYQNSPTSALWHCGCIELACSLLTLIDWPRSNAVVILHMVYNIFGGALFKCLGKFKMITGLFWDPRATYIHLLASIEERRRAMFEAFGILLPSSVTFWEWFGWFCLLRGQIACCCV